MTTYLRPSEPRYLLVEEVAKELRFDVTAPTDPIKACRKWLTRHAIPVLKRGTRVLVDRNVMRAALGEE